MGLLWGCYRWGEAPAGIKGRVKRNSLADRGGGQRSGAELFGERSW